MATRSEWEHTGIDPRGFCKCGKLTHNVKIQSGSLLRVGGCDNLSQRVSAAPLKMALNRLKRGIFLEAFFGARDESQHYRSTGNL